MKTITVVITLLLSVVAKASTDSLTAGQSVASQCVKSVCPVVKIEVERLPDLNIPRAGHETFIVNGEYTVVGGHTNGFVPTPTAEYYKNGEWHLMQMVYNHDFGTALVLKSGKVLLAGGVAENIGVGQTFTAEFYDPATHTFEGFGSMNVKRAKVSALELDSGQVVVSGNWYHDDCIELFDGKKAFSFIKKVSVERSYPYIFRIAKDDALIISGYTSRGDSLFTPVADCLRGDTVSIPLLRTWHPLSSDCHPNDNFIGDERQGVWSYLMPVQDGNGQLAIAKVENATPHSDHRSENGNFTLLPTACPVPMQSQWDDTIEYSTIIADRRHGRAYMLGLNGNFRECPGNGLRYYLLAIDYTQDPAPLTLYYTDLQPVIPNCSLAVDGDGNLLITGGFTDNGNFKTSNIALLLHVGTQPLTAKSAPLWWQILLTVAALLILVALLYLFIYRRRHHRHPSKSVVMESADSLQLMNRICDLMENRQLYLNSDLKIIDVAMELGSNRYYISECINTNRGCSFNQFVNTYRIEYAQQLLRTHPDIKLSEVWMSSGFSTERTFLRAFKAITGMTPSEFKGKND